MARGEDKYFELRAIIAELGILAADDLDALRKEADASGKPSVWVLLREKGILTRPQSDSFVMAAKGYIPVDQVAATFTAQSQVHDSSSASIVLQLGPETAMPLRKSDPPPKAPDGPASRRSGGFLIDRSMTPASILRPASSSDLVLKPKTLPASAETEADSSPTPVPPKLAAPAATTDKPRNHTTTVDLATDRPVPEEKKEARRLSISSLVGRSLGKYSINNQLGKGASGVVLLGNHTKLNIPVAIKVLDPMLASHHPELLKRFMHEARSAARLGHPNIVRVIDCDEIDGFHIIVMEYVDGFSVADLIKQNGVVAEDRALNIVHATAEGLEAALEAGIIHRDIKPANIMVTRSRQVKLADLGLAKNIRDDSDPSETRPNIGLGTPHYFSPEQAMDAASVDFRSDIYSLGVTLYHMLVGHVPFKGRNLTEIIRLHMDAVPTPPCEENPSVSRAASDLCLRMLAKKPEDRFSSYQELLNSIGECIVHAGSITPGNRTTRLRGVIGGLFSGARKPG